MGDDNIITLQHPVFECIRLQFVFSNTDATGKYEQGQTQLRVKTPLIRLGILQYSFE
jgi:hypothetical protein